LADVTAIAAAATTTASSLWLMVSSSGTTEVYWFGGWHPRGGTALGIDFAIDPIGAGLAALAGLMVTLAFLFSIGYFDEIGQMLFQVLMLIVLAAMGGFALTGDLFDMFVFLELMSVAAVALTMYMNDEAGPLQGGINFLVTSTVGAFLMLIGITLLYARTGALNLAEVGRALAGHPADGLVVTAFVLIAAGLLTKAATVPLHLWLVDAYTVAPLPVAIVFPGVLGEMGLYGLARVYTTVFAGPFSGHQEGLRWILVAAGVATALVGAAGCLVEIRLKRLLAYATLSHLGMFLAGLGLLEPVGLAGVAVWIAADAPVKAALFMLVGAVRRRASARGAASLIALGGLLSAAPPLSGGFLGKSMVAIAAQEAGFSWLIWVIATVSALVAAALLRAAWLVLREPGRAVPLGADDVRPLSAWTGWMAGLLLAAAVAIGLVPQLAERVRSAATLAWDRSAYVSAVLGGQAPVAPGGASVPVTATDLGAAVLSLTAALAVAAMLITRPHAAAAVRRTARTLTVLQTGHVGEYVAWMMAGVALLGGASALVVR
jgi:multicomponent Na+:H+ antiporter subunit D